MRLSCSAPGKVILSGEHAVVYGTKAVAAAIDLRARVTLEVGDQSKQEVELSFDDGSRREISFNLEDLSRISCDYAGSKIEEPSLTEQQEEALDRLTGDAERIPKLASSCFLHILLSCLASSGRDLAPMSVRIESGIPLGAGLGSSAAVNTCFAALILLFIQGSPATEDLVEKWAFTAERLVHGTPSGLDNAVSIRGGALIFSQGRVRHSFPVPNRLRILVVNTGIERNTKHFVELVAQFRTKFRLVFDGILAAIDGVANEIEERLKLEDVDHSELRQLFAVNHDLLRIWGVSHESLDGIVHISQSCNAAAKLTGAGGGGCAIVIPDPAASDQPVDRLKQQLLSRGFTVYEARLGCDGLQYH